MKKLLVIAAALPIVAIFAMGADCSGSNVQSCATDADCTDAASPLCNGTTCEPAQCSSDDQCQATDSGGDAACQSDSDCSGSDLCLQGDTGNNHCVTPNDPPGSDCGAGAVEVNGTDVDGTSVPFCADPGVSCNAPRCTGGQFG